MRGHKISFYSILFKTNQPDQYNQLISNELRYQKPAEQGPYVPAY